MRGDKREGREDKREGMEGRNVIIGKGGRERHKGGMNGGRLGRTYPRYVAVRAGIFNWMRSISPMYVYCSHCIKCNIYNLNN